MSSLLLISRYRLYDFLTSRGRNAILEWVRDERLTTRDRAMLNQKLTRLSQMDYDLAVSTKLLSGPIFKSIYKLTIHGDVMLRPMLCRGPIENEEEYTLLLGAIERGGNLPKGAKEEADERRSIVIDDPTRRAPHERIL
jgi:hypothetical protein